MSLAARLAFAPSRGLAFAEAAMLAGGMVVLGATLAIRFAPAHVFAIVAPIAVVACAVAMRVHNARLAQPIRIVAISDRDEVDVSLDGGLEFGDPWRLQESTLHWPGLSVVALAPTAAAPGSRPLVIPALHAELAPHDAWALSRFLRWRSA